VSPIIQGQISTTILGELERVENSPSSKSEITVEGCGSNRVQLGTANNQRQSERNRARCCKHRLI
jgi:hypothetical protein